MCIPPRVQANVQERTARRSVPAATFVGGVGWIINKVVCPLAGCLALLAIKWCVPLLACPLAGWRRLTK